MARGRLGGLAGLRIHAGVQNAALNASVAAADIKGRTVLHIALARGDLVVGTVSQPTGLPIEHHLLLSFAALVVLRRADGMTALPC